MTVAELRAEHPDLVSQIEAAAREGMITQADHDSALTAARAEAASAGASTPPLASLLALHGAVFGAEANKKFAALVETGITADQATALGITSSSGESESRSAILEALTNAASGGVKPVQVSPAKSVTIDTSAIYASRQTGNKS